MSDASDEAIKWETGLKTIDGTRHMYARGDAIIQAYEQSEVTAEGHATVIANDLANVYATGATYVYAHDRSAVTARGECVVFADGESYVYAYDNAIVFASQSAAVDAYDHSIVVAASNVTRIVLRGEDIRVFLLGGQADITRDERLVRVIDVNYEATRVWRRHDR
jgi:hypothetical protein